MEHGEAGERGSAGVRLAALARARGIGDERVLAALAAVPREAFLPNRRRRHAARDRALPIGLGQTTSQPTLIALILAALAIEPGDRVLEVGAGCGYQTALLEQLGAEVFAIERHPELAELARANLTAAGFGADVVAGDGTRGRPEHAPYDAIVVAATGRAVPRALADQLTDGGRLIAPITEGAGEQLILFERDGEALALRERLVPVRFVPLVEDEA